MNDRRYEASSVEHRSEARTHLHQLRGGFFVAGLLGALLTVTTALVVAKFHPHLASYPNRWVWYGVIFVPYLLSQLGLIVWFALKIFRPSRRNAASTPEAR
ncbi:MAG: hypothetical protein RL591_1177 [Planctomycetota bacterium]|jgi:hypothetical protein